MHERNFELNDINVDVVDSNRLNETVVRKNSNNKLKVLHNTIQQ